MVKIIHKPIALITGASRGLGRQIAISLAASGYNICVVYKEQEEEANKTAIQCKEAGVEAIIVRADVSQNEDVESIFQAIKQMKGTFQVLVNNAGIRRDGPLMLMSEKDWDDVIAVNLKAAFLLSKKAIRLMISKRYGKIINIVSPSAISGREGQTNYASSKGGLISFTRSFAREVAPLGIRVNAVCPGVVLTDMVNELKEEIKQNFLKAIPQGKFGKAEDIASAVVFLSSKNSDYITGQVIQVDGGLTIGH